MGLLRSRLPQPARADELTAEIEEADIQRARFEQEIDVLAAAPAEFTRLRAALAELPQLPVGPRLWRRWVFGVIR